MAKDAILQGMTNRHKRTDLHGRGVRGDVWKEQYGNLHYLMQNRQPTEFLLHDSGKFQTGLCTTQSDDRYIAANLPAFVLRVPWTKIFCATVHKVVRCRILHFVNLLSLSCTYGAAPTSVLACNPRMSPVTSRIWPIGIVTFNLKRLSATDDE